MKKILIKANLILIFIFFAITIATAQPGGPGNPPGGNPPVGGGGTQNVPLNGPIFLLIAAGVGYGIMKIKSNNKGKKAN